MKPTYLTSDLHLHDEDQPFLFTPAKESIFVRLVHEVSRNDGRLILAGDTFDLTAMSPLDQGLREFFLEVLPASALHLPEIQRALRVRTIPEQIGALKERNPRFFDSLGILARQGALTLLPGNHDCALRGLGTQRLIAEALGVSADQIRWTEYDSVRPFVIATHGNQFDASNRTDHSCENRGAVITAAVYQAIMPAATVLGLPREVVAAIPAVRPEEEIVRGLQSQLGEAAARKMMVAFVNLLARNGYFHGIQNLLMHLLTQDVPVLSSWMRRSITPARIRKALPSDTDLKAKARQGAELVRSQAGMDPVIVVLGHTHELDYTPDYVNLGTWIDHLSGLTPGHMETSDRRLPVLCIKEDPAQGRSAILYDARGLIGDAQLVQCPAIWSSNASSIVSL